MLDDLDRLRNNPRLLQLCKHYANLGKLDQEAWQNRLMEMVEDRFCASHLDGVVEEANVFVHSLGIFDRLRALFLENHVVVMTFDNGLQRLACVPVLAKRCSAGADEAMLDGLAPRRRQLCDQVREIVAGGEAVADE